MKRTSKTRNRRWTEDELELFNRNEIELLTDEENNFASSLETLALKKSANNEVFESLKIYFRSSRPDVFYKKGVLRNFTKFTGKHQCQSLRPATLLK